MAEIGEADRVMLNPEYADRLEEGGHGLGRPLTEEELKAFGKFRNKRSKVGLEISPTFFIRQVRDKEGKFKMVPFVGIRGSF